MKILFCCEFYSPSVGGVQEVVRQIGERLAARGHHVTVATTALSARTCRELRGVRIAEFAISGNLVQGMKGEVERYQQFVTSGAFDLVVIKAAQQWAFDALWPVLSRIPGRKIFIPCGFSCLYEPSYAEYFENLPDVLKQFDHLVFYASDYRDIGFAKDHGLGNFSIIPNGASEKEFDVAADRMFRRRYGMSDREWLFLTVGSPASMKGHLEIATAFFQADFDGRPATLMLNAGTSLAGQVSRPAGSPLKSKLSKYWKALRDVNASDGLPAAIRHLGHGVLNKVGIRAGRYVVENGTGAPTFQERLLTMIDKIHAEHVGKRVLLLDLPREELVQAYIHADLFLFASRVEYSPLVLFEAAAAGTPFLSVQVGNAPEIAEWTGAGEICPAGRDERGYTTVDPTIFGAHWSRLARNRARLAQLGETGKRNWAARFTWDKITDQYERLFEKVVQYA
jgi:glycosyltransferase involved in cell wall biosynthesis